MLYRLKSDVPGRDDMKAGQVVFPTTYSTTDRLAVTVEATGYGKATPIDDAAAMLEPVGDYRAADFERLAAYFLEGRAPMPNFEPMPTAFGLSSIACGAGLLAWPKVAHVLPPMPPADLNPFDDGPKWPRSAKAWARVFLGRTQAGALDGTGIGILYLGQQDYGKADPIFRFALCRHDPIEGAGARPERGWRPARCARCGLDLSVDSSD